MSEFVTAKSGGSSNATSEAIEASLVFAEQSDIFICSAPGRIGEDRSPTAKVSNMLLDARSAYESTGDVPHDLVSGVVERYRQNVNGLSGTSGFRSRWIDSMPSRVRAAVEQGYHEAFMIGEQLQSEIYVALGFKMLNPGRAGHDLGRDPEAWRGWLSEAFSPGVKYAMPGNITKVNGHLETFSPNGSDTTSGFAAYGIRAALNLNLSDRTAMSADPNLIDEHRLQPIDHLLYVEGRELGRSGTGLLHPEAMVPLMRANIPTHIHKTLDPNSPPTIVDNNVERAFQRSGRVMAVSLMNDVSIHRVHEPGMAERVGRLAEFERALAERNIGLIDSDGDGVDDQKYFVNSAVYEDAADVLEQVTGPFGGAVDSCNDLSFVTLVGLNLDVPGFNKISRFARRSEDDIPRYNRYSVRFVVDASEAKRVLSDAHEQTIEAQTS